MKQNQSGRQLLRADCSRGQFPVNNAGPDAEFERWFSAICVPAILSRAREESLAWQGKPLKWEVCHEILACAQYYQGKYSPAQLIQLSNTRYERIERMWPGGSPARDALEVFYRRTAEILPWGHGVFPADHDVAGRRCHWLRRLACLRQLQSLGVESVVDYGAGGGHTSLLAKAMGFSRVGHHEYGVFHPYVLWRAGFIQPQSGTGDTSEFFLSDAAQPLALDQRVQAICCMDVAEHVYSPEELIEQLRAALLPGGYLVWVSMFGEGISCHLHGRLAGKEEELLARHGFHRYADLAASYGGYTGLFQLGPALTKRRTEPLVEWQAHAVPDGRSLSALANPIFASPAEVYLASADRMDLVLDNLSQLRRQPRRSTRTYASVIGGLSGLNYLLALAPAQVIFYDVNPTMLPYAQLVCELIGICSTPQEFISRVFCRQIVEFLQQSGETNLTVASQEAYLARPADHALLSDTLSRLSKAGRRVYQTFLLPHHPGRTLDGERNCRRLLPCWPVNQRVPVGGGQAFGCDESGLLVPNTNTFFYGLGWLESAASFQTIRSVLGRAKVVFKHFNLLKSPIADLAEMVGGLVLHFSNIDDWFPQEWPALVKRWENCALAAQCRLLLISSHNGVRGLQADSHAWAFAGLAPLVTGKVVEVTHKVPWGFHEFPRTNVTVAQYLAEAYLADTTILHILIGEGIARADFLAAYRKALRESKRILVLEHNRDSVDWGCQPPARFVTEPELRTLLVEEHKVARPARLTRVQKLAGEQDDQRNLLFVVETQ